MPKFLLSNSKNDDKSEVLTVHLRLEELLPNNLKGTRFCLQRKIICKSMKELANTLKELKDPKNSTVITNMIHTIFEDYDEKIIFGKIKSRIYIDVYNGLNLPIVRYTKLLFGGYEFKEDKDYAEEKI